MKKLKIVLGAALLTISASAFAGWYCDGTPYVILYDIWGYAYHQHNGWYHY